MRFKGSVKSGKNKGDVIEYSAEEKAAEAVKLGIISHEMFKGYLVYVEKMTLDNGSISASPVGEKFKKLWANNTYSAKGQVTVARRHAARDKMVSAVTVGFVVKFRDALQENGLPDLKIDSLTLSE